MEAPPPGPVVQRARPARPPLAIPDAPGWAPLAARPPPAGGVPGTPLDRSLPGDQPRLESPRAIPSPRGPRARSARAGSAFEAADPCTAHAHRPTDADSGTSERDSIRPVGDLSGSWCDALPEPNPAGKDRFVIARGPDGLSGRPSQASPKPWRRMNGPKLWRSGTEYWRALSSDQP